ncbi:MAG: ATP-binding protein [Nocardioides sp.]|uniref:sensor histidine kinase n=1 Tax=Nocardioides sp. TaxID=35761 RepID=UPI0032642AE6
MTRLVPRWSGADSNLAWLMRLNFIALTVSFVILGTAYTLGFRHTAVLIDLGAMTLAEVLLLASLPLTHRYGNVACILALTLSATGFSVAGTWSTPNLVALTTILMLIPLLVGFPYASRGWLYVLMANAVIGSAALAALSEWRRITNIHEGWVVNAIVIGSALPGTYLIVIFLVRNAYQRLQEQSDQLRQSRTRVVEVADAARKSLERDLHDGAQQRLLAMSVTIERARKELAARRTAPAEALLLQLSHDNLEVLSELRELARGIYPPLLTERGLVAAIQSAARRSVVPVTLDADSFPRPAQQIEVAAYFCIMEALTNAAKHSGATDVHITVRGTPQLTFTVSDNGRGFDAGSVAIGGLLGMEARAAAAGGTISLDTAPGRGTSLTGTFPLDVVG